jgi:hypothetical protein
VTDERNPVDQLVELFVYAPIGLLYERDDVLPRLVTRGRSQVQLARVVGQLAVRRGQGQLEERLTEVLGPSGAGLAKLLTEVGALIGLAPPPEHETSRPGGATSGPGDAAGGGAVVAPSVDLAVVDEVPAPSGGTAAEEPPAAADDTPVDDTAVDDTAADADVAGTSPGAWPAGTAGEEPPVTRRAPGATAAPRPSLPIAGYDQLRAREVIALLVELSPAQRRVIRDHELSHRGRKTVLHQLDLLGT